MVEQIRQAAVDDTRPANDSKAIGKSLVSKLFFELAKFPGVATTNDHYLALAYAVRDRLLAPLGRVARATTSSSKQRTVIYLSAEYLIGPQLGSNLLALGLETGRRAKALGELGLHLDDARRARGGAGPRQRRPRPARRLLHGLARDARHPGRRPRPALRVRHLRPGHPRRLAGRAHRPLAAHRQPVGDPPLRDRARRSASAVAPSTSPTSRPLRVRWIPERVVEGVPYDMPVAGYGTNTTNFLRLWSAVAARGVRPRRVPGRRVLARRRREDPQREPHEGALPERLERRPASSCASSSSTSSSSCALQDCIRLLLAAARPSTSSPTSSRSSSTTRTRRSRCPS